MTVRPVLPVSDVAFNPLVRVIVVLVVAPDACAPGAGGCACWDVDMVRVKIVAWSLSINECDSVVGGVSLFVRAG